MAGRIVNVTPSNVRNTGIYSYFVKDFLKKKHIKVRLKLAILKIAIRDGTTGLELHGHHMVQSSRPVGENFYMG